MTYFLVTYASKHESTAEIAKAIGEVLQQIGTTTRVDVMPVEYVEDVTPYDAVVVGSAVYAGQWQPKAVEFLKKYEADLAERPVWVFSSGPTGEGDPKEMLEGWELPKALEPMIERIEPHDVVVFHGSLDPAKLNFLERLVVRGVKAPTGDFRDWDVIRGWAYNIARALQGERA